MLSALKLSKKYGTTTVLKEVSFSLSKGNTLCIIGTSGSGKTTLLRMINRMVTPTSGTLEVFGKDVIQQDAIALRRKIGYVIQGGGLFPHWTVSQNAELVGVLNGWPVEKRKSRTRELLDLVGLEPEVYASRYPAELSGGQQQRVSLVRALFADPELVLLDEPFSALDPISRTQLQDEFLSLKQRLQKTMVFVTHDVKEAWKLGDLILLLNEGKAIQMGTPETLENEPASDFVSQFIREQLQ